MIYSYHTYGEYGERLWRYYYTLHREDGYAVEMDTMRYWSGLNMFYLFGVQYDSEEYYAELNKLKWKRQPWS